MLRRALHKLVEQPAVYDAAMAALGARQVERALCESLSELALSGSLLDVGGGTGASKPLLPASVRHTCLDLDPLKLRRFVAKFPGAPALRADATRLPFADECFDNVMCAFVAHHLDDAAYRVLIDEAGRVLRPGGRFVFADPLYVANRWPGRLLWRYDRGRFPRSLAQHQGEFARRFRIECEREFTVIHAYTLLVGRKRDPA